MNFASIWAILKALLPALEPAAQAAIDAQIVAAEAQINAAPGISPDWKIVENAALAMVKVIIDAEGQRLLAKSVQP